MNYNCRLRDVTECRWRVDETVVFIRPHRYYADDAGITCGGVAGQRAGRA